MKSIFVGKKVDNFIKKTKLKTTLAKNNQTKGCLFSEFSIEPKTKGLTLFLTDKDVCDIFESSKFTMVYVNLISCQLLSEKSFRSIAMLNNLRLLRICNNKYDFVHFHKLNLI